MDGTSVPETKRCTRCDEVKALEDFVRQCTKKDGRGSRCKACVAEVRREKLRCPVERQRVRDAERARRATPEAQAKRRSPAALAAARARCRRWRQKPGNLERERARAKRQQRTWYENRAQKARAAAAQYRRALKERHQNDPSAAEEYRVRMRAYCAAYRARKKAAPEYLINKRIGANMRNCLRNKPERKRGRRWEALVGYSLDDLMAHLERQFAKGMTWKNMGDWHIDHIVPLASFRFDSPADPEFRAAWSLTNLRPLWAAENVAKSANRTLLL